MTVYIDIIFLENIFMNYIILFATSIILKKQVRVFRKLISSIIGAIYATFYYISNMEIYSNIILKVILSIVMVYISFGSNNIKEFLKEIMIFYLTSFTFGGVTFALLYFISPGDILFENGSLIGIYPLKIILVGGIVGFIIITVAFKSIKNRISKKDMFCKIKIKFDNKETVIHTIIDTGNFLKEPISNIPVAIVEKEALREILPDEILNNLKEIISGEKTINEYIHKIRIIPFFSLGKENGILLGIRPDEFIIEYQEKIIENKKVLIGIYDRSLSKDDKYKALIGIDIIDGFWGRRQKSSFQNCFK